METLILIYLTFNIFLVGVYFGEQNETKEDNICTNIIMSSILLVFGAILTIIGWFYNIVWNIIYFVKPLRNLKYKGFRIKFGLPSKKNKIRLRFYFKENEISTSVYRKALVIELILVGILLLKDYETTKS